MEIVIITFFVTFALFAIFIIAMKLINDYRQKRLIESYSNLIVKLRKDIELKKENNLYSLEEYRIKKLREKADSAGGLSCQMIWCEEIGEYIEEDIEE
tara:strand:+ start:1279 stop:1572 length:294 start_codon:yes stop_codon:yes gene_type:complete